MTDLRTEAIKMALERLFIGMKDAREHESHFESWMILNEAICDADDLLRQALAQPEQEPVAIVNEGMGGIEWLSQPLPDDTPLYTAPQNREWVGLTDEELPKGATYEFDRGVRWAETKLKEKNT